MRPLRRGRNYETKGAILIIETNKLRPLQRDRGSSISKETAYIFRKVASGKRGRRGQGGRGLHSAKSGEFSFPRHPHVADIQPNRYFNLGKVEESLKNPCLKLAVSPHG